MTSRETGDTAWVLEPILQVPHVVAAVLLTRDGLVTGYTDALTRPSAERVAAITSSVQGACRTAAAAFADRTMPRPSRTTRGRGRPRCPTTRRSSA
ncbi:roadblock/LC7 domain-containing protein [Streptomyces sp. TRM68367]|uniref:roadblock/LC7 domain-containing protein n=1 Tax=Streptomyces sp. TRM68367 TaxID=2758415 RepID=UPI0029344003|nr:roadblock/LC7 domain-containing protein [Streptomyces sp. TRM68367]